MRTRRASRDPRFENGVILAGKPSLLFTRLIRLAILGRQRIRLAQLAAPALAASVLILGVGVSAHADSIMINNGLAPPNAANVIDDTSYQNDDVYVRNVGCPPGWPAGLPGEPCPSPGDPTEVSLVDGGVVGGGMGAYDSSTITVSGGWAGFLRAYGSSTIDISTGGAMHGMSAYDSSTIIMSDGYGGDSGVSAFNNSTLTISGGGAEHFLAYDSSTITMSEGGSISLTAHGSSSITMSGGFLLFGLSALENSTARISGGTFGDMAENIYGGISASDSSIVTIVGNDFAVDGSPVPYGHLTALGYLLTGTLASGDSLEVMFGGTIILVPEPTTSLLVAVGLAGLAAAGRRRSHH